MKKLLFSSILGLAALGMSAAPSHAWTFGLIPHHCWPCNCFGCGCDNCCGTVCIRPYNAFSPVASGSMCFDGCNPFCCGGYPGGNPGCYGGGPVGTTLPACDGCPTDATAPPAAPPSAPPVPSPAPNPGPGARVLPYGGPIQAAGAYGYGPMAQPNVPQPYYGGYGR